MIAHECRPLAVGMDLGPGLERPGQRAGVLAGQREVHGLHADEVEHHGELVARGAAEVGALFLVGQVDLAKQDRVASPSSEERPQRLQIGMRVAGYVVGGSVDVGDEERHGVHAEAGQPELQPEPDGLRDVVAHGRVGEVEVGLVGVEMMQVPLAGAFVELPDAVLLVGEDDLGGGVRRRVGTPDVVVAVRVVLAPPGRLEPRMVRGRVVDDEVGDHTDAPVTCGPDELDEVAVRAEPAVHPEEIGHVVAVVAVRRRVEGHQPQAGHAELGEIVNPLGQPRQVTDPVAVGVVVGLDVGAVDDRVLPPQVARAHGPRHRLRHPSGRGAHALRTRR